jgi:hypothetical protein
MISAAQAKHPTDDRFSDDGPARRKETSCAGLTLRPQDVDFETLIVQGIRCESGTAPQR